MPAVLRRLVHDRGTTPRDLRAAVRRLDRGLVALVPDEDPVQRRLPEFAGGTRPVARERPDRAATGREAVARREDAELVALRVGEHLPGDVRTVLTHVDPTGPEGDQAVDLRLAVVADVRGEVDVETVLDLFALGHRDEHQPGRGGGPAVGRDRILRHVPWDYGDLVLVLVDDVPVEHLGPPAGLGGDVVAVDDDGVPTQVHAPSLPADADDLRPALGRPRAPALEVQGLRARHTAGQAVASLSPTVARPASSRATGTRNGEQDT